MRAEVHFEIPHPKLHKLARRFFTKNPIVKVAVWKLHDCKCPMAHAIDPMAMHNGLGQPSAWAEDGCC